MKITGITLFDKDIMEQTKNGSKSLYVSDDLLVSLLTVVHEGKSYFLQQEEHPADQFRMTLKEWGHLPDAAYMKFESDDTEELESYYENLHGIAEKFSEVYEEKLEAVDDELSIYWKDCTVEHVYNVFKKHFGDEVVSCS